MRNHSLIPARDKRVISLPKLQYRLSAHPAFCTVGNVKSFLEVKPPEHYGQYSLHLVPRLRIFTAAPPPFHMPLWYLQGQLDLHLYQICVMPVSEVGSCFVSFDQH